MAVVPSKSKLPAPQEALFRLESIVESSDDAIITKDLNGIITSWNPAAVRMFGYTADEIVGQSVLKIIPPELQHEEQDILRRLRKGERIEHYETIRVAKDGSKIQISMTVSPIRDDQGNIIGASQIGRNISDRLQSDEARFRLAAIVESSDDAIVSKDLTGIIRSWNAAASRLFGWKAEEIIGRSVLTLIPPELQSEEPEILRKLTSGERIDHYETVRIHKDGHRLEVSLTVSPVRDSRGKVIGASKIARDVTERNRLHKALIESEKLAATGRMAASIAHEINNPLEAMTNLAYLLATDDRLHEEARRYANALLEEMVRASHITKQTLSFYRATTKPENVDVCELLDSVIFLNHTRIEQKAIQVHRDYAKSEDVFGFTSELRQVFSNLVLNAIEAVPEGGEIRLRVRDEIEGDRKMVRIDIIDNGHGIPDEIIHRLFHPFFTTKTAGGNGLGLWVSRGLVEKHGGTIEASSVKEPGRSGAVFTVILPTEVCAPDLAVARPSQQVAI